MPHTCVNDRFDSAPAKRVLLGDKRKPEPGSHIIEFSGGAVEVTRLDDGAYWVHIIVNRKQALKELEGGLEGNFGSVVDSRIDWAERRLEAIPGVPDAAHVTQVALLIRPEPRTAS